MKGTHDDKPPENPWQAVLRLIWNRPPLQRNSLLAVLIACFCVFLLWASLPTNIQERLIFSIFGNGPSSSGTAFESITSTRLGEKPIPGHQSVGATSEWRVHALNAAAFHDSESEGSVEKALELYERSIEVGGEELKESLDKTLLKRARSAARDGNTERAVELYREAFTRIENERK